MDIFAVFLIIYFVIRYFKNHKGGNDATKAFFHLFKAGGHILKFGGDVLNDAFSSSGNCKCPYCGAKYDLKDGYYNCSECNKNFKKLGNTTLKQENCLSPIIEDVVKIFAFLSKADGTVTKQEVKFLKDLLKGANLNKEQFNLSADLFNQYKEKEYNKYVIDNLYTYVKDDEEMLYSILSLTIGLVELDGGPSNKQRDIIDYLLLTFGYSISYYEKIKNNIHENSYDYSNSHDEYHSDDESYSNTANNSNDNYNILGVKPDATVDEIKQAYRRLIKIYHPDMQGSKDLPDEIMKDIRNKFDNIQNAYSEIKKVRQF